jgi:hypothetical protein
MFRVHPLLKKLPYTMRSKMKICPFPKNKSAIKNKDTSKHHIYN